MSEWAQKRFWTTAAVAPLETGFAIELDGRRIKTPAKAPLVVPTAQMGAAIAAEWEAQDGVVDPATMPFTRSANAAIDKVAHQHHEVAEMLAAYGDSDLLCYRAEGPEALVTRQSQEWDPPLNWAAEILGIRLEVHSGVIHRPQPQDAVAALASRVFALTPFQMAGFHDLVSMSGSLVLALAVAQDWRDADEIWHLSRLDERWQEEKWGVDDEAQAMSEVKRQAFVHAKRFFDYA